MFKQYERTNLSFEEVFGGEYDLPLKNPPATILDIGANEGAFTAWALERWPTAKVIAFEPIPENADLFRKNHGQDSRVNFSQLAIAEESPVLMFYGKENSGQCSMFVGKENSDETVEVQAMSATELPSCELVKVDAEFAEVAIIKRLNLEQTKAICFEYHRMDDGEVLKSFLENRGFELVEQVAHTGNQGVYKMARPGEYHRLAPVPRQPIKVMIGVPSYFMVDPHFHRCLMMLFGWLSSQPDNDNAIHGVVEHTWGDSPNVGRSRNMITRLFLESDCTDLLFIDSDIVFAVEHVKRILSHPEEVVGGMYFKKGQGVAEPCLNTIKRPVIKPSGLNQVAYIGTGFLRIKRIVFEKIIEKFGDEIAYCPDCTTDLIEYNFWNLAMHTFPVEDYPLDEDRIQNLMIKYRLNREQVSKAMRSRWLSEDWWFCQRCNDLGFKVWADRRIILKHSGNVLYPLVSQEEQIFGHKVIYGSHKAPDSAVVSQPASPRAAATA